MAGRPPKGELMILLLFFLMQVMIGNAKYHCSCVRYLSADNTIVIIGGSTAGAVLLFSFIIVVVVVVRRRHTKNQSGAGMPANNNNDTSMNFYSIDSRLRRRSDELGDSIRSNRYNRHLPDDYKEATLRNLYSTRLPDEYEHGAMDNQYNRRLPDDYVQTGRVQRGTEIPDYSDSEHSQQLLDNNIGTTSI